MTDLTELENFYYEIVEQIYEYSVEDDIDITFDLEIVKQEILELFKFYRPIKFCDFEYGLSQSLKEDHRLIIKEFHDKTKVYEYCKDGEGWWCCGHAFNSERCNAMSLQFKYGILFAPLVHCFGCETREYSEVMKVQDFLKREKIREPYRIKERKRKKRKISKERLKTPPPTNFKSLLEKVNITARCSGITQFIEMLGQINEYVVHKEIVFSLFDARESLIKLLETHRPIKMCDYVYGPSKNLVNACHLIIREDKTKVREYRKRSKKCQWRCCTRIKECQAKPLEFLFGILFAPIIHSVGCDTKDYSYVQDFFNQAQFIELDENQFVTSNLELNEVNFSRIENDDNLNS